MTKQEQIDEMAKYICNVCEMGNGFTGNCSEGGTDYYKRCTLTQETAKALYDAGYRKVLLDTENGSCVDCVQYAPWQLVESKIEDLKSEIKRLEKENADLLKVCEGKFTFDTTQNKKYSVFNSVRKEFAKKLKVKALLHCRTINCYECKFIETLIDELLEEYENDQTRTSERNT